MDDLDLMESIPYDPFLELTRFGQRVTRLEKILIGKRYTKKISIEVSEFKGNILWDYDLKKVVFEDPKTKTKKPIHGLKRELREKLFIDFENFISLILNDFEEHSIAQLKYSYSSF